MKKFLWFSAATSLVLGAAFFFSSTSVAQNVVENAKPVPEAGTSQSQQSVMRGLIDAINNLAKALNPTQFSLPEPVQPQFPIGSTQSAASAQYYYDHYHGCFDNFRNWAQTSQTYDPNQNWSLAFVTGYSYVNAQGSQFGQWYRMFGNPTQHFIDVNGDGLVDYLYSFHGSAIGEGGIGIKDCVALNTGTGWNIAYKCVQEGNDYYGDCAG